MIDCYLGLSRSMHVLQDGSNVSFLLGDPMVKWKVWAKNDVVSAAVSGCGPS
jgi:hypothetical protein